MSTFQIGDLVVLTAGSMRMAVEAVEGEVVSTLWCHEGRIGRDSFNEKLLKKFEFREDAPAAAPAPSHARPYGGPREGGAKRYEGGGGGYRGNKPEGEGGGYRGKPEGGFRPKPEGGYRPRPEGGDDKPRPKTGWDGKPREKKYFRKED